VHPVQPLHSICATDKRWVNCIYEKKAIRRTITSIVNYYQVESVCAKTPLQWASSLLKKALSLIHHGSSPNIDMSTGPFLNCLLL